MISIILPILRIHVYIYIYVGICIEIQLAGYAVPLYNILTPIVYFVIFYPVGCWFRPVPLPRKKLPWPLPRTPQRASARLRSALWPLAEPCRPRRPRRPRPGLWCRWRRCTPGSPMFQLCHRCLWAWDLWDPWHPWGSKVKMRRNTGRNCNMSCWVDVGVLVQGVCFDLG